MDFLFCSMIDMGEHSSVGQCHPWAGVMDDLRKHLSHGEETRM